MTDKNELKRLASLATPGRNFDRLLIAGGGLKYECTGDDGSLVLKVDHKNDEWGFVGDNGAADEEFFLACTPAAVLALIADVEALRSQVAALQSDPNSWQSGYDEGRRMGTKTALDERDQLKAENEKLKSACSRADQIICDESKAAAFARARGNLLEADLEKLKAENEALRKELASLKSPAIRTDKTTIGYTGCIVCGEYTSHGGLQCPNLGARSLSMENQRIVPVDPIRVAHPLESLISKEDKP